MTQQDKDRAAFETWHTENIPSTGGELVDRDGVYLDGTTETAWKAWQAAIAHMSKKQPKIDTSAERVDGVDTSQIELPPLPNIDRFEPTSFGSYGMTSDADGNFVEYDDHIVAIQDYARQAIAHERQQRGEPESEITRRVYKNSDEYRQYISARFDKKNGTMNSFEWDSHRWAYRYTAFDDAGDYDLIYRPAPQPAEPVAKQSLAGDERGGV